MVVVDFGQRILFLLVLAFFMVSFDMCAMEQIPSKTPEQAVATHCVVCKKKLPIAKSRAHSIITLSCSHAGHKKCLQGYVAEKKLDPAGQQRLCAGLGDTSCDKFYMEQDQKNIYSSSRIDSLLDLCVSFLTENPELLIKVLQTYPNDIVTKILSELPADDDSVNKCLQQALDTADVDRACLIALQRPVISYEKLCNRLVGHLADTTNLSQNIIQFIAHMLNPERSCSQELLDAVLQHTCAPKIAHYLWMAHLLILKLKPGRYVLHPLCFALTSSLEILNQNNKYTFRNLRAKVAKKRGNS